MNARHRNRDLHWLLFVLVIAWMLGLLTASEASIPIADWPTRPLSVQPPRGKMPSPAFADPRTAEFRLSYIHWGVTLEPSCAWGTDFTVKARGSDGAFYSISTWELNYKGPDKRRRVKRGRVSLEEYAAFLARVEKLFSPGLGVDTMAVDTVQLAVYDNKNRGLSARWAMPTVAQRRILNELEHDRLFGPAIIETQMLFPI